MFKKVKKVKFPKKLKWFPRILGNQCLALTSGLHSWINDTSFTSLQATPDPTISTIIFYSWHKTLTKLCFEYAVTIAKHVLFDLHLSVLRTFREACSLFKYLMVTCWLAVRFFSGIKQPFPGISSMQVSFGQSLSNCRCMQFAPTVSMDCCQFYD